MTRTMVGMRLRDVPTAELRRMIRATEQSVGRDGRTVEILRRELARRQDDVPGGAGAVPARGGGEGAA